MPTHHYQATIAGIDLNYDLRYEMTVGYLGVHYIKRALLDAKEPISVKDYEIQDWKNLGNPMNAHGEYSLLSLQTSEYLLHHNRCVFHSVAFIWNQKAWLLTAAPGVGKSTQFKNLRKLYPDEITILNGDRPVLEARENGRIIVHSSPWNGKENWYGFGSAPLAGVIYLKQTQANTIEQLIPQQSVTGIMAAIFHSYENKEIIQRAGDMATKILKSVPVWLLSNKGDLESSELLYQTIKQWDKEHPHGVQD